MCVVHNVVDSMRAVSLVTLIREDLWRFLCIVSTRSALLFSASARSVRGAQRAAEPQAERRAQLRRTEGGAGAGGAGGTA